MAEEAEVHMLAGVVAAGQVGQSSTLMLVRLTLCLLSKLSFIRPWLVVTATLTAAWGPVTTVAD